MGSYLDQTPNPNLPPRLGATTIDCINHVPRPNTIMKEEEQETTKQSQTTIQGCSHGIKMANLDPQMGLLSDNPFLPKKEEEEEERKKERKKKEIKLKFKTSESANNYQSLRSNNHHYDAGYSIPSS